MFPLVAFKRVRNLLRSFLVRVDVLRKRDALVMPLILPHFRHPDADPAHGRNCRVPQFVKPSFLDQGLL
jgi:hypothetical protein